MPNILELKEFGSDIWARLDIPLVGSPVYLYTSEEIKQVKRSAIRAFVRDLADNYIKRNLPEPPDA
jgi:hypothetical protein